jgi:uncharacterized protein (TIGR02996 family)
VSDINSFLAAIEAEPTDDALWLVFADWLEEHGEPSASDLRDNVEKRSWRFAHWSYSYKLDARSRQLLACDCLERALPCFERCYPNDRALRRFLEFTRHPIKGNQSRKLHARVVRSLETAARDMDGDKSRYFLAHNTALLARDLVKNPDDCCWWSVSVVALSRSQEQASGPTTIEDYGPVYQAAVVVESRWLLARSLRYWLKRSASEQE